MEEHGVFDATNLNEIAQVPHCVLLLRYLVYFFWISYTFRSARGSWFFIRV